MFTEQKIIIVVPARLGDALFCTPAIQLLKKQRPAATLAIVAPSALAGSIFQYNPAIQAIYVQPDQATLAELAKNYQLVIALHANEEVHQLASAIGLKTLYIPAPDFSVHQAEQALRFMQTQLACEINNEDKQYTLYPQAEHINKINSLLTQQPVFIGLHLGCHSVSKNNGWKIWKKTTHPKVWPLKNFIKLAQRLQQDNPNIRFVITGSKGEEALGEKFARKIANTINLINKTSVLDMAALMNRIKLFICCDTGPLHVACATQVKLIALFGPTNLQRTGPYPAQTYRTIIQKPTLSAIDVMTVYQAVKNNI
jgi:ADP-heptose:LPS heptosyltransferase